MHSICIQHLPAPINWNGDQVTNKQCEPNGQRRKHLQTHWVVNRDKLDADSDMAKHRSDMLSFGVPSAPWQQTLATALSRDDMLLIATCIHLVITQIASLIEARHVSAPANSWLRQFGPSL